MPRYLVLRDTWISHENRKVVEGEEVDIEWPKGSEPKKIGPNLSLVQPKPASPVKKPASDAADLG